MAKLIPIDEDEGRPAKLEPIEITGTPARLEPIESSVVADVVKPVPANILAAAQEALGGILQFAGSEAFGPPDAPIAKAAREKGVELAEEAKVVQQQIAKEHPLEPGSFSEATRSALTSIGLLAPALATGNVPAILTVAGSQAFGADYDESVAEGAPHGVASPAAGVVGASEVLTEMLPVKFLFKYGTRFVKRMLQVYGSEIPGEQINTVVEHVVGNKVKEYTGKPKATMNDLMLDLERTLKTTVIQTSMMFPFGAGVSRLKQRGQEPAPEVDPKKMKPIKLDLTDGMRGTLTFSAERAEASKAANEENTREARQALIGAGLEFAETQGFFEGKPKVSFVVKDTPKAQGIVGGLANVYDQDSVLAVDSTGNSVLIEATDTVQLPGIMQEITKEQTKDMFAYTFDPETGKYFANVVDVEGEVASTFDGVVEQMEQKNTRGSFSVEETEAHPIKTPEDVSLSSEDSAVEARLRAADGAGKIPFRDRVGEKIENIKSERQHFKYLDEKTDGVLIDILRLHESTPNVAKTRTRNILAGITAGLNKKTYRVFKRILALEDIQKDLDSGLATEDDLPFGYKNRAAVENDLAKYKAIADINPRIRQALDRRNRFMDSLRAELVERGLVPQETLNDGRYFHRQVLEHLSAKQSLGLASGDVRMKTKPWQKARSGKGYDFNIEYSEAEGEVIAQALAQIETHKTIQDIKADQDISATLKEQAKDLGVEDWRTLLPDGYVLWQPKQGNAFYSATTINEKVVDDILEAAMMDEAVEIDPADLREVMALGQKLQQWAVPERVARQLDNFRDFREDTWLGDFTAQLQTTWKQWTLLNPYRVIKYNLNNMSGDADIVLAYNPKIFKHFRRASAEAFALMKGKAPSGDMVDALKLAVADSGISINEIADLKEEGFFKIMMGDGGNLVEKYWNTVKGYTVFRENILRIAAFKHFKEELNANPNKRLYGVSKQTEMDALYDSENVSSDRVAAKLARELIGDYGNISNAGQWIRRKMIPFYSWMEINLPRYVRLMKNLPAEGRGRAGAAAVGGFSLAKRGAITGAKVSVLFAATSLWNMMAAQMLGIDEDERDRVTKKGGQHHIIIGRSEETGQIQTLRFQGALQDALGWFGLDTPWQDAKDLVDGDLEIGDKAIEMVKAAPEKLINASVPIYKTAAEALTGRKLYPNPWNPAPVRDKLEHILKLWSLDMPYRMAFKPSRGVGSELAGIVSYGTDVGEQAYADTVNKVRDFLEDHGKEIPAMIPKKKSNSLYWFKQAMKYGDIPKAKKFLKQYLKLGGTAEGIQQSIKMMHPLSFGNPELRAMFISSLSAKEQDDLKLAIRWYARTYLGTELPRGPENER
jgi:hypothetical protein